MRDLTETVGFTPYGVKNSTGFQRFAGAWGKVVQPFMGTVSTQAKLYHDFLAKGAVAARAGDWKTAARHVAGALAMQTMVSLIGGGLPRGASSVANTIANLTGDQDAIERGTALRSWLHSHAVLGQLMGGHYLEHVTIQEVPWLFGAYDNVAEAMHSVGKLASGDWTTKDTLGIAQLLGDGLTLGRLTSAEQVAKFYKAWTEGSKGDAALAAAGGDQSAQEPTKAHSTYVKQIGGEKRLGNSTKITTNTMQEAMSVLFPQANTKEAMVNLNRENVNDVRMYAMKQFPEQAKLIRSELNNMWKHYSANDEHGVMQEIPQNELHDFLHNMEEAHASVSEKVSP